MRDVAIIGAGMTPFGHHAELGYDGLLQRALAEALNDAGLRTKDVGAVFHGSVAPGGGVAQKALKDAALGGVAILNHENACASSSVAFRDAYAWIKAGLCDVAVAAGTEIVSTAPKGPIPLPPDEWIFKAGLNLPGWYALQARRHMATFGTTLEQLAAVVVKSRQLASANDRAHFRSPVTIEQVRASRMVADPLTLFQCCPKTDGAAAVVLASAEVARRLSGLPIWVRASAMGSGTPVFTDGRPELSTSRRVALDAYEQAAIGASDLDVVEVHDAFSIGEILYSEALGLCEEGKGGWFVESGQSMPNGGGVAVNTGGGLLSRGHPFGATGVAQIFELVQQLRGRAGARQVVGARIGAAHNMGANEFELDANVCVMHILDRD